jgi:hypothetical protein
LLLLTGAVAATAEGQGSSLTIVSDPAGAEIVIDGATVGTTPATIPLAPGQHNLKLLKEGFAPFERTVSIVQGSNQSIQAQLKEKKKIKLQNILNAIGGLQGGSSGGGTSATGPTGPYGQTGPATGGGQAGAGTGAGTGTGTGAGTGTPAGQTIIAFNTVPPGAEIRVDGSTIGVTPLSVEADPGSYQIEFRKAGYQNSVQSFTLLTGEHKQINTTLQASGSAGGGQAGAGTGAGTGTGMGTGTGAGTGTGTGTGAGTGTGMGTGMGTGTGAGTGTGTGTGTGAGTGTSGSQTIITFATVPPGAEIRVDGSMIGVTPLSVEADPGSYQIELRKTGYQSSVQSFTLLVGEHKQIYTTLQASGSAGGSGYSEPSGGSAIVPNISGTWSSNIGVTYEITQSGTGFTWFVARLNQNARGTIDGPNVSATWDGGAGSATGRITAFDINGRAIKIEWNNGVIFQR